MQVGEHFWCADRDPWVNAQDWSSYQTVLLFLGLLFSMLISIRSCCSDLHSHILANVITCFLDDIHSDFGKIKNKRINVAGICISWWTFVTVFIGHCYFFFGKPSIQLMSSMVDWIIFGDSPNVWSYSEILVINPHQMGSCGGSWFCWLLPFSKMGPLSLHSLLYFLSLKRTTLMTTPTILPWPRLSSASFVGFTITRSKMHLTFPFYLLGCKHHVNWGLCFPVTSDLSIA